MSHMVIHLSCKRDQIQNMRDYMDRRVTPSKRVTSPTWGPPPSRKHALSPSPIVATGDLLSASNDLHALSALQCFHLRAIVYKRINHRNGVMMADVVHTYTTTVVITTPEGGS